MRSVALDALAHWKVASLMRASEVVSSGALFFAMVAEHALEQAHIGSPSIARGVNAADRVSSMICFAVVFLVQAFAAWATTAIVRWREHINGVPHEVRVIVGAWVGASDDVMTWSMRHEDRSLFLSRVFTTQI